MSPIAYFVEISCPASFAKDLAETNIFRKVREIVFKMLSMRDLVIFNVPDERFKSAPNRVRILHVSDVDFWMLGIKTDFVKVLWTNSDLHFASS